MTKSPERYPLAWPIGRPRTKAADRRRGEFVAAGTTRPLPGDAVERLEDQIVRLGGVYPILSTNLEQRMDGRPRADGGEPTDPGVCVYFQLKGNPVSIPCDSFSTVAQNILAIANHIDAARRIESYGVGTAAETLQAFTALPPPEPRLPVRQPWWTAFGLDRAALDSLPAAVRQAAGETAFKEASKAAGTDDARLRVVIAARDEMRAEFSQ